jgi:hypothetical protein
VNTRINGALRRAGGRDPSVPADESVDLRRRWRTTLASFVVATMALGGMTALAATPAAADEAAATEQSEVVAEPATEEPVAEEVVAEEPAEEPADEPAAEEPPAEPPAEESAAPPAEEAAAPPAAEEPANAAPEIAEDANAPPVTALIVPPDPGEVVQKVEICHATGSQQNPYVVNEPDASGDVSGHDDHDGPIWFPGIEEEWGDIIPPFTYDGGTYPGHNWDAWGQLIYANDCNIPEEPEIDVVVTSCVEEESGEGLLEVYLSGLLLGLQYTVSVFDGEDNLVDEVTYSDGEGDAYAVWQVPPGEYTVVVTWGVGDIEFELFVETVTIEECVAPLAVTAEATGCSLGDDGTALVSLSGLVVGEDYDWILIGDDYFLEGTLEDVVATTLDVDFGDLPPGNYVFAIEWTENTSVYAEAGFFVEPCEPDITVVVHECPAYGGEGGAVVKLSNLVEGLTYEVWIVDQHENGVVYGEVQAVVGDATHMAEVDVSPLPAGKDYTAWVYAPWMPPGGTSDWGEVDWFEVSASVDFSLKPCPAAPPTPAKPAKPAGLATTGTDDTGGLMTAALILLGLGGAALVARGRRPAESRVKE